MLPCFVASGVCVLGWIRDKSPWPPPGRPGMAKALVAPALLEDRDKGISESHICAWEC